MKFLYQRAIDACLEDLGTEAGCEDILRVDPHKDGAALVQVEHVGGADWYKYTPGQVEQLELGRDRKLPAADRFGRLLAEGNAELLGWRPGKRATLRPTGGASETVLKGFRKGRSAAVCTQYWIAEQAAQGTCLDVPRVQQHDPGTELIEMSVVPGDPLGLNLTQVDEFFRLGHGLRAFQSGTPQPPLVHHGRDAEIVLLTRLAARVMDLRGELPAGWSEAASVLGENIPVRRPSELVLTHRDLHDGQLLAGEGKIGLLDFDLLCLADPALDVANLTAHLRLRAVQRSVGASESVAEQLSVALLEGLDRSSEDGFLESLRFYQATSFLRLSLVYFLRPRWNHVVPSLVSLASRCIHEMASA